jgi:UPF0755 protein
MVKNKTRKKPVKKRSNKIPIVLLVVLAIVSAAFFYTVFLRPATSFNAEQATFYIPTKKADKRFVKELVRKHLKPVQFTTFLALSDWTGYWEDIKPGRYVIDKNTSVFSIFRKLKGGRQTPVELTINKFRTKRELAKYVGGKLECTEADIYRYISNNDSIQPFGVNQETLMTLIIPNTYEIYWNSSPSDFMKRMNKESNAFWTDSRIDNAKLLGLSKAEVITIASIVEEETNNKEEKPTMASVYINRLKKGMALGADPTIKFALGDFSIRRVTFKHISSTASSPYNTYRNKGLPPGPICTPSISSIDAVLKAEKTDFLFFCANADFSGSHSFASTEDEHFENARKYRRALDSLKIH